MQLRKRLAIIAAVLFILIMLLACETGPSNPSSDYCNTTYGSTYDGKPVRPVGC